MERIERDGKPYLDRWHIAHFKCGQRLYLHYFHRGDAETYNHDHPWSFWSLILWGGYWEVTPGLFGEDKRRWYFPLSFLRRPAEWRHRVQLNEGRIAVTLVWTGRKERSWGFWCPRKGFVHWRQHEAQGGCGDESHTYRAKDFNLVYYPTTGRALGWGRCDIRKGDYLQQDGGPTLEVLDLEYPGNPDDMWIAKVKPREV